MSEEYKNGVVISDEHIDESSDEFDRYFYGDDKDDEAGNLEESTEDVSLESEEKEIVIGIDLGTTNSCVGIWKKNNLEIIPDDFGNKTIPSTVAFTNKARYIGKSAKNQIEINTENTFYEVKRLIGRKYDDKSVENDLPFFTYKVEPDKDNNILLKSDLKNRKNEYTPEEISAMVLMELKNMAERYLKKTVTKAVITTPAYFNDSQREATRDAATIAGLECVRIINEPTAAALAYGLEQKSINKDKDMNVVVYDLGGGTLDVSLLNICDGVFEVLASTGNTHMGGVDFDHRLVSFCITEFKKKNGIEKIDEINSLSLQRLRKSCENAKKVLSVTWKAIIAVKDFYEGKNLYINLTRDNFEKICRDLFILCLKPVEDVLKSCDMDREDIDEIILVGGATRMPLIRDNLRLYFRGKEPNSTINPDEVVAAGACIQGYIVSNQSDPFSENVVLLDVIPLSLGVETIGEVMDFLVPRNSVIPIKRKRKYTTDSDYQSSVLIRVFEGERQLTKDNFLIGEFELQGIEPAPRGVAKIEVTFSIDINGIISITAEDLDNNQNKNNIIISGNKNRLSPDKIKSLVDEAKEMELRDKISREKKQYYYEIEDMCNNVLTNIKNEEFKLKDKDKDIINRDIKNLLAWLESAHFLDHEKNEYLKKLERLQKQYATLVTRCSNEQDNIKGVKDHDIEATSVFSNDDEDDNIYEEIEDKEMGLDNDMDEDEKKEMKQLRETLVEMCYSLYEILNEDSLRIEEDDRVELKDYINDTLLWVHVEEKISKAQYKNKIDEINDECNKVFEKVGSDSLFEENQVTSRIKTKRDELEQLCYAIKSSIISNLFSLEEDVIQDLDKKVDDLFDWLIDVDLRTKKAELTNTEVDINEDDYQGKIDEINELCNSFYYKMMSIDMEQIKNNLENKDILTDMDQYSKSNDKDESNSTMGTSIFSLKEKRVRANNS